MRTASCQCRGFRDIVEAELDFVSICHCQICPRRTRVPLTCNAYFPKSKVRLEGQHKIYSRDAAEGRKMHTYFCPPCGSTVGWTLDLRPNQFGVEVDCFNDRNFPPPIQSNLGGGDMRLGGAASGHSAFPTRSTRSKRRLKRSQAQRCRTSRLPPHLVEKRLRADK